MLRWLRLEVSIGRCTDPNGCLNGGRAVVMDG